MERLTIRKHDYVLLKKDGQTRTPMELSGQEVRLVMERLAELEDAIEQGKLVEVVRCVACESFEQHKCGDWGICTMIKDNDLWLNEDFCSYGKRKPEPKICLTEDCPYQKGNPCEAAEGCGGYEGAE